jgi:hypothetical protein
MVHGDTYVTMVVLEYHWYTCTNGPNGTYTCTYVHGYHGTYVRTGTPSTMVLYTCTCMYKKKERTLSHKNDLKYKHSGALWQ